MIKKYFSFVFRIPCTISEQPRLLCHDTISNIQRIYMFIASDAEICLLLARFRLWPLIFIPRTIDTGEFLFVHEVFWHDPESLLTVMDANKDESFQRFAIQAYYNNNKDFQRFFFEIFQIKQEPTLDDYLLLLSNIKDKKLEYIWKCINVITRLAFTQNKQAIVKDRCVDWPFIPCMNNVNKFVKYTDQPYYPHDIAIADLFSDEIPIIKLSGDLIHSSEFKQRFCSLFNIEDLADVIDVLVTVDNEQPAIELLDFYSYAIDLIQHVLINNENLSETRSSHLQSIFSDMKFVSVDCIRLSYQFKKNDIRKASPSSNFDSYIDESTRKFYILQSYEKNDGRHIDTMVNYLIQDVSARLRLSKFIQKLFKVYQVDGIEGLIKQHEGLPEQKESKWVIPRIIQKESDSSSTEEKADEVDDEIIIVPPELLAAVKNEPALQKPFTNTMPDPDQPKSLTCFPPQAGAVSSDESLNTKHPSNANNSSEQTDSKKNTGQMIPKENDRHNKTEPNTGDKSTTSHSTPLTVADFISTQSGVNFEHIRITNFADIALSPTTLPNPPTSTNLTESNNETDAMIGRRGEEFVYRYLLWKYPDAEIQWINHHHEFGQPFDIQMIRKGTNNQKEFVEVKTTRIPKQNTFQISIGEVECLLVNQNNYYIYRVYLANDDKSSTITILNQIKCHLQQKQIALSITIKDKLDEE